MVPESTLPEHLSIPLPMKNNLVIARFPIIVSLVALLAGCQPKENIEQLKAINVSLEKSNEIIKDAGDRALTEMENDHRNTPNSDRIVKLLLIMRRVKTDTDSLVGLIERLKRELLNNSVNLKVDDAAVLNSLHEPNSSGDSLLNKVASFKDNIPAIFNITDSSNTPFLYATFKADIKKLRNTGPLLPDYTENMNSAQRADYCNKWLRNNLRGSSVLMTMVVLNKLENDVLYTRTFLMDYCSSQVGEIWEAYEKYSAIAVLNSSYVKRGQTIEVTAGAAGFGAAATPGYR